MLRRHSSFNFPVLLTLKGPDRSIQRKTFKNEENKKPIIYQKNNNEVRKW